MLVQNSKVSTLSLGETKVKDEKIRVRESYVHREIATAIFGMTEILRCSFVVAKPPKRVLAAWLINSYHLLRLRCVRVSGKRGTAVLLYIEKTMLLDRDEEHLDCIHIIPSVSGEMYHRPCLKPLRGGSLNATEMYGLYSQLFAVGSEHLFRPSLAVSSFIREMSRIPIHIISNGSRFMVEVILILIPMHSQVDQRKRKEMYI